MRDLEAKCATLTDKVHEKTAANNDLVRQVQHLRAVTEGDTATADKMDRLSKENAKLKSQVEEMLSFLKQSGLEWVGFKRDSSAEHFTDAGRSLGDNSKNNRWILPLEKNRVSQGFTQGSLVFSRRTPKRRSHVVFRQHT